MNMLTFSETCKTDRYNKYKVSNICVFVCVCFMGVEMKLMICKCLVETIICLYQGHGHATILIQDSKVL